MPEFVVPLINSRKYRTIKINNKLSHTKTNKVDISTTNIKEITLRDIASLLRYGYLLLVESKRDGPIAQSAISAMGELEGYISGESSHRKHYTVKIIVKLN